jgi:ABC-type multidrug transport system fused ATPase/permease subunit
LEVNVNNAEILLLDEATSSLDAMTEKEIIKIVNKLTYSNKKLTILMISHRESSLSFCDRIIRL